MFLFDYFRPCWVFVAMHGLSSCGRRGLFFAAHGLLVAMASLVATIQEIADDLFYRKPLPGKEAIWDAKYLHHSYPG